MRKILQLLLLLATVPIYGQLGTAGQQEYARALTNGGRFGSPRYTTTNRPTCNASNLGGVIWNTTTATEQVCDGSTWASVTTGGSAGAFSTVTASSSVTVGTTTTAGTATCVIDSTMGGASATDNFINCTGTYPASSSANDVGVQLQFTSNGSSAFAQQGMQVNLAAGFTGAANTRAIQATNTAAGTTTDFASANMGAAFLANGAGAGTNVGASNNASGSTALNIGNVTRAIVAGATNNVGLVAMARQATNNVAVYGLLSSTTATLPAFTSTAALFDNVAEAADILLLRDNGTEVYAVGDNGNYRYYRTMTAAGTTGARTIDKPNGSVNFAAAATTLVVTNALATTTSSILVTPMTNDGTCKTFTVTRAAGSFTITASVACTAETAVAFLVTN